MDRPMDCSTAEARIAALDPAFARSPRGELLVHLATCESCRDLYRGFEALRQGEAAPLDHPSSESLAAWAVAPGRPTGAAAHHLRECRSCRREYELVRAAVVTARPVPGVWRPRGDRRRWGWLAAAALFLALGTAVFLGRVDRVPNELTLSGDRLSGDRTLRATESILVGETAVDPGGTVKLQSGDRVAFRDGFSVGSDAALSVILSGKRNS